MLNKPSFNRPKIYINLLSDFNKGITEQRAVYSMVIEDEFTLRTPDALLSGKATEQIIQNCCPEIQNPEDLLICDIQHLLANIKIASTGSSLDLLITCPKCSCQDPYELNLSNNINSLTAKKWFSPLDLHINGQVLSLYFKSPSYNEYNQYSLSNFKLNKQIYQISQLENKEGYEEILLSLVETQRNLLYSYHSKCIEKIVIQNISEVTNFDYIQEWCSQLDIQIQNKISDYLTLASKESCFSDMEITCSSCDHKFTIPIDLDFCSQFRNKLVSSNEADIIDNLDKMEKECKKLTSELLKLIWYMRGSISYSEAYHLTLFEREAISKIIQENMDTSKKIGYPIF
jgi:hypothetical protein